MNFVSTRNANVVVRASEAISQGISKDGGLFVPADFPFLGESEILAMCDMDYAERAAYIFSKYLTDIGSDIILDICRKAYAPFEEEDPAALMKLDDDLYVLELFHGPTLSYRDMALTVFPYLYKACREKAIAPENSIVLAVGDGDFCKAALEGFKDFENVKIAAFYGEEGLSDVQKLQLTTQEGENLSAFAVKEGFLQCQESLKKVLTNAESIAKINAQGYALIAANLINFGYILPQIVYYFSVYCDLINSGELDLGAEINFSLPTGDFSNLLAGFYAKKMGLPIQNFICATCNNDAIANFLQNGTCTVLSEDDSSLPTDNIERLLFELFNRDTQKIQAFHTALEQKGEYSLSQEDFDALQETFYCGICDEEENIDTISHFYEEYVYALDPNTASAVAVLNSYICETGDETPCVVVSIVSPYKFPSKVYQAIADKEITDAFKAAKSLSLMTAVDIPEAIASLKDQEVRFTEKKSITELLDTLIELAKK